MILDRIISFKKKEIAVFKKKNPLASLRKSAGGKQRRHSFYRALSSAKDIAVIAEIKRRSPSKGILRRNFKPVPIARDFEKAGAAALSVLTDEKFFGGSVDILRQVRAAVKLPLLRKDFILDECQVYEAALA